MGSVLSAVKVYMALLCVMLWNNFKPTPESLPLKTAFTMSIVVTSENQSASFAKWNMFSTDKKKVLLILFESLFFEIRLWNRLHEN